MGSYIYEPIDVTNGVTLRWRFRAWPLPDSVDAFLVEVKPLLQRIHDGHSVEWDQHGGSASGSLTADAQAASGELRRHLQDSRTLRTLKDVGGGDWLIERRYLLDPAFLDSADPEALLAEATASGIWIEGGVRGLEHALAWARVERERTGMESERQAGRFDLGPADSHNALYEPQPL